MSQLCGEPFNDQDEFGLTDAIRLALKSVGGAAVNAVDVRTKLQQLGYDVTADNILPNIHTILKRLVLKGELDDSATKDGKTAYRWIEERLRMTPPPADLEILEEEDGIPTEPPSGTPASLYSTRAKK